MARPLPQKDWATLLHFGYHYRYLLVTNYPSIKLLVTYNFSACRGYLAESHLSFPSATCWVRHSNLLKGLRLIPYTCGSSNLATKIQEISCVPNTPNTMANCRGALVQRRYGDKSVIWMVEIYFYNLNK